MNQVPKGLSAAALVATVAVSSVTQAQLEEVIVTATKIETSIQDTPIAVSAFTQERHPYPRHWLRRNWSSR
jgi:outer membrane receptor protein involved in Fe transport